MVEVADVSEEYTAFSLPNKEASGSSEKSVILSQ
jgi:hypothetical protein